MMDYSAMTDDEFEAAVRRDPETAMADDTAKQRMDDAMAWWCEYGRFEQDDTAFAFHRGLGLLVGGVLMGFTLCAALL